MNIIKNFKRIQKIRNRLPVLDYVETHLVDHCNLNCICCNHYSSISPEYFADINEFKKDFTELAKKVKFKVVRLLGGEPLLHPNINEFLVVARGVFPKSRLAICTNGLLLNKMSESFWETCRNNNIIIDLSRYPVNAEMIPGFIELIEKNDVKAGNIHPGEKMYVTHNKLGNSDKKIAFERCGIKNFKITVLRNGRMYTCPKATYIDIYNFYYGMNIPMDKGVDIYKHTGRQIVKYLAKPINACKYCMYCVMQRDWKVSLKAKEEWDMFNDPKLIKVVQNTFKDLLKHHQLKK